MNTPTRIDFRRSLHLASLFAFRLFIAKAITGLVTVAPDGCGPVQVEPALRHDDVTQAIVVGHLVLARRVEETIHHPDLRPRVPDLQPREHARIFVSRVPDL
jgi:hypothetical protein